MINYQYDISSEEFRIYHYKGGETLVIDDPQWLFLLEGREGVSHRVVTKIGECYRPEPGYLGISWVQNNGRPFDF